MARFSFCGPTYQSASVNADAQRSVNLYPEAVESGKGKSDLIMLPTPALTNMTGEPGVSGQSGVNLGIYSINGRLFQIWIQGAIAGGDIEVAEISSTGFVIASTSPGAAPGLTKVPLASSFPADVCSSPTQLLVVWAGHAWVIDLTQYGGGGNTLLFTEVTSQLAGVPYLCGYSDGYFVILFQNSQKFQISQLLDATVWNALDVGQVSVFPDNVISMLVDHREIWFAGSKQSVAYYNSGNPDFPFEPIPGAFIEQGIAAPFCLVRMDNSAFWIGMDERGSGIAWRAQGYVPVRVSNHAIENEWASYSTITDAEAYAYQDRGHAFWVIRFPTADKTWVYDAATQMWHERTTLYPDGHEGAHRSRAYAYCFGKHITADWLNGTLYQLSSSVYDDLFANTLPTRPIRRMRRAPHVSSEQQWIFHSKLQVDLEVGNPAVGINVDSHGIATYGQITLKDGNGKPRSAQVSLRWSDDGGHTWSNEHIRDAGEAGEYKKRVIWRRLGRSRDRVYEISWTDPVAIRIIDAYLEATPGFQVPTDKLSAQLRKAGVG